MDSKHYRGAFVGMATGDALGAPSRGMKPGRVKQLFNRLEGMPDPDIAYKETPSLWRMRGLYSSPSQQALAVADSILISAGFDINDIIESLLTLGDGHEEYSLYRGADPVFLKALTKMKEGRRPPECSIMNPGISALTRALPLALYFREDPDMLEKSVIECTLLSHNDPRAIAGALAYAHTVTAFTYMNDLEKNPEEFIENLCKKVRQGEERLQDDYSRSLPGSVPREIYYSMSNTLKVLIPCLKEKNNDLVKMTLIAEANRQSPPYPISVVSQDFAPIAISYIIYISLKLKSFGMGILDIINEGKKSCTCGAITGSLLGLKFGMDGIDQEWQDSLINFSGISLRGSELAEFRPDWTERTDLVLMEKMWSVKEQAERKRRIKGKEQKKRPGKNKNSQNKNRTIPDQEDACFAPPPGQIFGTALPDPVKSKKEKALRGKKRIDWKEKRRKGKKGMKETNDQEE
jgi:ADP-ribosylglycohydrolase